MTIITLDTLIKMEQEYLSSRIPLSELCRKYGACVASIRLRLIARGVKMRNSNKHIYNESFFEKIDTEQKAYVLGFFYADGNTSISKRGQYRSGIGLCSKDVQILEDIRDLLCPGYEIRFFQPKQAELNSVVSLTLTNRKITEDLMALGCVPRKSEILKFPTSDQVPEHLLHHFIRGYFDGDGNVCISKGERDGWAPKGSAAFECSPYFADSIHAFLKEKLGIGSQIRQRRPDCKSRAVKINGNLQVFKLGEFLYKDATIFLRRKKETFDRLHEQYLPFAGYKATSDPISGRFVRRSLPLDQPHLSTQIVSCKSLP